MIQNKKIVFRVKSQCKNLVGETLVVSRKTGRDSAIKPDFTSLNKPFPYILIMKQASSGL